jgi:hypothetical protein
MRNAVGFLATLVRRRLFWQYELQAFAVTDTAYLRYKHYHETTDTPDKRLRADGGGQRA